MANIGFIGLGIMGRPMAVRLINGGHDLFLHSRSGVPEDLIAQGGKACASPGEVAENSEIIITMLPRTADVEQVLFGEKGVTCCRGKGGKRKTIVDMSSISPFETRRFAERIGGLGWDYMDAPVSGGDIGARNGTLTIMAGAAEEVFRRLHPVLQLMGQTITRVGDPGAGQVCKIANQIIVAGTIEAVGEGLLFASKAGADPARVREALLGGFAASRVLEVHGKRMITHTFDPGFRIELHQKDLELALSSARAIGVSLPNTAATQEMFTACVAHGDAKLDSSTVVKVLERLANHEIGHQGSSG